MSVLCLTSTLSVNAIPQNYVDPLKIWRAWGTVHEVQNI